LGKLQGEVILKNSDGSEKKARYHEGKFMEWVDNQNVSKRNSMMTENVETKKGGMFCCKKG